MMSDAEIWRRTRDAWTSGECSERALLLAAHAEGQSLDQDERALVAEWLARDVEAAGDVAAAKTPIAVPVALPLLTRAISLVPASAAEIIPFRPRQAPQTVGGWAGWGSLVAAMVVAGWLGFSLGVDTLRSWQFGQGSDESVLREMLDPSPGFMRDLSDGAQT